MKRKRIWIALLLTLTLTLSSFAMTGCGEKGETFNAVQVELNPGVEFIVDKDNKVVSATALNDDGAVVLSGEVFVGKTAEEAVELFVTVSAETGYLLQGTASYSKDTLTLSVSANGKAAKDLYSGISQKIQDTAAAQKIAVAVEQGQALGLNGLRNAVKRCRPDLTEEEINGMKEAELLRVLADSRKETAELISVAMREAYYDAKAYRVSLAESDAVKTAIAGADSAYAAVLSLYGNALEALRSAVESLEELQNRYFIAPESDYQVAAQHLLEAKKEVLEQREKVEGLADGAEKIAAQAVLTAKESALQVAENALAAVKTAAELSFEGAETAIRTAIESMESARKSFPEEIATLLNGKASEIDAAANQAKDAFFAEFEEAHADAIARYNANVAEMKAAMQAKSAA